MHEYNIDVVSKKLDRLDSYLLFTDIRIVATIIARAQMMAVTSNNIWFLFILAYRDE